MISAFTASSLSLAPGGGEVVLAWQQLGATELAIDNGVGSVVGRASVNVAIADTTTFTLTATNAAGTAEARVTVDVAVATEPPVIRLLTATPAELPMGGGTTRLQWNVDAASRLEIAPNVGDVTGSTQVDVRLTESTRFTLTATNPKGFVVDHTSVSVYVPSAPPVITAFNASSTSLPPGGGNVTFSWTVTDASALSIDNQVGNVTGRTSIERAVSASGTYTLTATNALGSTTSPVHITVQAIPPPTIQAFTASPSNPTCASYISLLWQTTNATSVTIDNVDVTDEGGSYSVYLNAPKTFTLRATNTGGTTMRTVSVTCN